MLTKYEKFLDGVCESEIKYISTKCDIVPSHSITMDGFYGIYFNEAYFEMESERLVALAHEKAHCDTGTLYSAYAPPYVVDYCERKADKKAAHDLIPFNELIGAIKSPWNSVYDLAEYFCVTPEFMQRALEIYEHDLENYFRII